MKLSNKELNLEDLKENHKNTLKIFREAEENNDWVLIHSNHFGTFP
jgi:hypothetical protein